MAKTGSTPNVLANDPRFSALANLSGRLGELDVTAVLVYLVDVVSADVLPHLAEQFHVMGLEGWSAADDDASRRALIKRAIELHRRKGTPWALREVLRAVGYADAVIEEGLPALRYDGVTSYSGAEKHSGAGRWALFRVLVDIGENKGVGGEELTRLLGMIESVKPARSVLRDIGYRTTVADDVEMGESLDLVISPSFNDIYPKGRRYDGGIRYDQAKYAPRVPLHYAGARPHDGSLLYDGLAPAERLAGGERHDNHWDEFELDVGVQLDEAQASSARCDGRMSYEGATSYGGDAFALDRIDLSITRYRRHNGRLKYNGTQRYAGAAVESFSS